MRRIGLAARLLPGLAFLATAIGKLLDNRGFARALTRRLAGKRDAP